MYRLKVSQVFFVAQHDRRGVTNRHFFECPYFTALQYINNLETKRSYKWKVNLINVEFFKKPIERFKNYSLIC